MILSFIDSVLKVCFQSAARAAAFVMLLGYMTIISSTVFCLLLLTGNGYSDILWPE